MSVEGMVRAARLDPMIYEEVVANPSADRDAQIVVLVIAVVGAVVGTLAAILAGVASFAFLNLVGLALQAVLGWLAWSITSHYVGVRLLGGKGDLPQIRRISAYAVTPTLIAPLVFFPGVLNLIALLLTPWLLATGFLASRAIVGSRTDQAVMTTVFSFLAYVLVGFILGTLKLGAAFGL
jgi:hypothetical protein